MASPETVLKEFLPSNEAKVYLALLSLGSASASEITERCGLHRANVYDCLENLHQKGIITIIVKSGKKFFETVSPDRLKVILAEKKRQISMVEESLDEVMPELSKRFETRKSKQLIHHLVGPEGLRTVAEEMLKEGEKTGILYTINSAGGFRSHLPLYFKQWNRRRVKKKIQLEFISPERRRTSEKLVMGKARYLPDTMYSPLTIEIFGDKCALFTYEEYPIAIFIENKNVAESFKKQFDVLWKVGKP